MTAKKKTPEVQATATLRTSELHTLLGNVVPFVDGKHGLPILECVNLAQRGPWLVATATDRYAVGVQKFPYVTGAPEGWNVNLSARVVREILRTFRRRRGFDPDLTLTFNTGPKIDSGWVAVERAEGMDFQMDLRMKWHLFDGEYPAVAKIITGALSNRPSVDDTWMLDPNLLKRFAHLGMSVRVVPSKKGSPLIIRVDQHGERGAFIGAIMPQRLDDGDGRDLTPWRSALGIVEAAENNIDPVKEKAGTVA